MATRFITRILKLEIAIDLIITPWGWKVLDHELELSNHYPGSSVSEALMTLLGERADQVTLHDNANLFSRLASGSSANERMIVIPCSVGTMSRIATGQSRCLLERAADVVLKEHNLLVLAVRESPLSIIQLRNLLTLAEAGGIICPPMLAFYHHPHDLNAMLDLSIDVMLRALRLQAPPQYPWSEPLI